MGKLIHSFCTISDFVEDRLHLGYTKKRIFLWYFTRFALSLRMHCGCKAALQDKVGKEELVFSVE